MYVYVREREREKKRDCGFGLEVSVKDCCKQLKFISSVSPRSKHILQVLSNLIYCVLIIQIAYMRV